MILQFYTPQPTQRTPTSIPDHSASSPNGLPNLLFVLLATLVVFMALKPFIEFDKDGTPRLANWRKHKMEKEIKDMEEAEQYVLVAEINGLYPCYSCPNAAIIHLTKGEIWKYGITTKGKSGRYGNMLEGLNLKYIPEFKGTLEACLKEERRKIYHYAVMPENLVRPIPLIRPPGNKKDS